MPTPNQPTSPPPPILLSFGHLKEAQFWWSIQKMPNSNCVLRESPILV